MGRSPNNSRSGLIGIKNSASNTPSDMLFAPFATLAIVFTVTPLLLDIRFVCAL